MSRTAQITLLTLCEGILSTTVDVSIAVSAYMLALGLPTSGRSKGYWAEQQVEEFLDVVNYASIKQAIANARRRGLIKKTSKGRFTAPEITKLGRERLVSKIPLYQTKRPWNKRMYLITYDIPEKRRRQRNIFRELLLRLGCAKIQASVWFTLYDPSDIIREHVNKHSLSGTILVSSIGPDGSIGDENIHDFIVRIFRLTELNERYEEWIRTTKNKRISFEDVMEYLRILRTDPQLPFQLLPAWWKGDIAYLIISPILTKMTNLEK